MVAGLDTDQRRDLRAVVDALTASFGVVSTHELFAQLRDMRKDEDESVGDYANRFTATLQRLRVTGERPAAETQVDQFCRGLPGTSGEHVLRAAPATLSAAGDVERHRWTTAKVGSASHMSRMRASASGRLARARGAGPGLTVRATACMGTAQRTALPRRTRWSSQVRSCCRSSASWSRRSGRIGHGGPSGRAGTGAAPVVAAGIDGGAARIGHGDVS